MSYTTAQLEALFTNANEGFAPDAATQLLLAAYAQQTQSATLTDAQALSQAINIPPPSDGSVGSNTPQDTTDVALGVYQFFTGMAPTLAGLDYLVNGGGNPNDLDSAYYAGFNQANRYYNFAINLITGNPTAAANFAASYGAVTFDQAISSAYEFIVGTPIVGASAAAAAVAAIEAQLTYFQTVASEIAPGVNQDLATKAIAIAYIIEEGVKAGVGYYANAINQFDTALAMGDSSVVGETSTGIDLLTAYPYPVVGQTYTLTPGVDIITPPNTNNNTVNGTELTLNSFDNINLGTTTGNVLNWVDNTNFGGFEFATHFGLVVNDVQTANFSSKEAIFVDTSTWGGLDTLNIISFRSGSGDTITAGPDTAVNVNDTVVFDSGGLTVNGGSVDTIVQTNGNTDNGDIVVNGGTGTTTVDITQTYTTGDDSDIAITDNFATIANVTLDGLAFNEVDINGGSIGLANLTVSEAFYTDIFIDNSVSSPSTLNLNVDQNYSLFVEDQGGYSTVNVNVGAENEFSPYSGNDLVNTFLELNLENVTTENVTGAGTLAQNSEDMISLELIIISGAAGFQDFTLNQLGHSQGNLTSIDASGSSGPISVNLDAGLTAFTGGAGTDFVVVFDDATVPITGGSAGNNEIVLNVSAADLTASTYANVSNFEILGTGFNSSGTYNLQGFSSPTQIADVDVRFNPDGALIFTGAAVNQTLMVDATVTSPITLVQGSAAAADAHDTLNLVLGVNGGDAHFNVSATDGIDTSNIGSGSAFMPVGTLTSVPEHPGATTLGEVDVAGKALLTDTWSFDITTAKATGGFTYTDTTSGAHVTESFLNSIASDQATTLAADINTVDGSAVHATASGSIVTVTSLTSGAGGDVDLSTSGPSTNGEVISPTETQKGQNPTAGTGTLTVTNTDISSQNELTLQYLDGSGNVHTLSGFVDLTIAENPDLVATAIAALMNADNAGFSAVASGDHVTFDYLNPGDHGLGVDTDTVPQVDNIDLSGVTGNVALEQFEITVDGPAFSGGSETFISKLGDPTINAVLNDLAAQFNHSGIPTYTPGATVSGDTLTLTGFAGHATDPFTDSGVLESVFSGFFVPVGGQAITANGYETLNLGSDGTNDSGTGVNTSYVVDNALTSLVVSGVESLALATSGGQHLAFIDTTGASGNMDLYGVNGSEVTTGITANIGDAGLRGVDGAPGLLGNADTGFTDVVTAGNGSDFFVGTGADVVSTGPVTVGSGGNSIVTFGDGFHDQVWVADGANTISLGNGATDQVVDISNSADSITLGNGFEATALLGNSAGLDLNGQGSGAYNVTLGNGIDDYVRAASTGNETIHVGSGVGDTVQLWTGSFGADTSLDTVTFGGTEATLDLSNVVGPSFLTPTTTSQVSVLTNNTDIINGLVHGDTIVLTGGGANTDTVVAGANNMAGVTNEAVFTTGTYSGGVFTYSATGHDALLTYDTQGSGFVSVVLVGGAAESTHAVLGSAGHITF